MSDSGWGDGGQPTYTGPGGGNTGATNPTAMASNPGYPVTAGLDAPREVARWRVIGNCILAIPHLVILYVLQIVANVVAVVAWFFILFTGQLPQGMGDFIAGVHRYQWRVISYVLFLREPYPAFGVPSGYADPGGDPAWLQITPASHYSRLAVLLRFLFVIPQALFGIVLYIGFYFAWIAAFFAVLFTGRWPEGLRKFVVGIGFWGIRVGAWYQLLADPYPPFSID